jgi:hypothetical protein
MIDALQVPCPVRPGGKELHLMEQVFWGWVMVAIGLVVAIFGARAFRLGLAVAGFAGGFLLAFYLLGNFPTVNHILVSLLGGAVGAALALALVRWAAYLAGALLGLAVALVFIGAIGLRDGGGLSHLIGAALALGAIIGGGLIGPMLGNNALLLASAGLGSMMMVAGFQSVFGAQLGEAASGRLLSGPFSLALFIAFFLLSALGQVDFGGFGTTAQRRA